MNKINAVIFDLDGVLVSAKELHYRALNQALGKEFEISWDEHLSIYDGLKTRQKLQMLSERKGLPLDTHDRVWKEKQRLTLKYLAAVKKNQDLYQLFKHLKNRGYSIGICSNSIRKTVLTVLGKLELFEFIDVVLTNEDVKNSKPHPEIYWRAMSQLSIEPTHTLIVEDSPHGLAAASSSKAHVIRVNDLHEVNLENLSARIDEIESSLNLVKPKWVDKKMNVLMPMAGAGSRFTKAGYTFPKPLIDVDGKPMIQLVVENLNIDANFIFVVQREHRIKFNLNSLLKLIAPRCTVVEVDGMTEGAACTALLAKEFINNDSPLFFANSDQFVEWDSNDFFYKMNESRVDGGIPIFKATHPKWSFVKLGEHGLVELVKEKDPISDNATVGFYYWSKGRDFVRSAEKMIAKDIRVNGEFYVCPVYNEAIEDGLKISGYNIEKMWGIGTPEDLNFFLQYKLRKNVSNQS